MIRSTKVKSQKYRTPSKIQNGKSLIKWQTKSSLTNTSNACITTLNIPDLVYTFSYVEHRGFN